VGYAAGAPSLEGKAAFHFGGFMNTRIALALLPLAAFSLAAKGGCGGAVEEPILPAPDAGAQDASPIGDCPIPEPTCPPGKVYSVAGCECVSAPQANDAGIADCPIPEPTCPPGSVYSVAGCHCVAAPQPDDAGSDAGVSDCPIPEPTCPAGSVYSVAGCECVPQMNDAGIADCPVPEPTCPPGSVYSVAGCECVPQPGDASTD
jgi:hypothetical protein